ncbi:efflux RND transporter permease subunit [Phaeovibrio sulfidiphilus]|uniref:Efflux RND transporter permease subunit n=1 Tax=Phaeovibrio sulfidiphilus TaxID=1220600 RepID=A0A8J6YM46_9PROT|nr:efflux RND transporter permease subunit [Phaeovibrio sulfidiphilus]MBE1236354.1 efflux RND transporter permease subunit [Phaeovibrio sulfidiphilus]
MHLFDIFIRRPVLATVVSLLIFVVGLNSALKLQVRQYPEMQNTVITVSVNYPGADADLIQGFITQPLQESIATAEGLDYIVSSSYQSTSQIKAYVILNSDPNAAMTEVSSKVSEVRSVLPRGMDDPVIVKDTGDTFPISFVAFYSNDHSSSQIVDYLNRTVKPVISAIPGISEPKVFGNLGFSIRVWLDPERMAQQGLTPMDVQQALTANSYTSAAGATKSDLETFNLKARTDLTDVEEFNNLVVFNDGSRLVRLRDIASVELAAENTDASMFANGKVASFMALYGTPEANPLSVMKEFKTNVLPDIKRQLPEGMSAEIFYDSTTYIEASIAEVVETIWIAVVIVTFVIFMFMGSLRSVTIPVVTMPLSIIGVCAILVALGFSINLLTLLAVVLAIGLVVDDAIVVVENIHRHIEEGKSPFQAAIIGTREIAAPVISMTITLAAVYAPIAFMGGITGALFKEFALTLAGSVVVSGIVALTLSPMMCSKILRQEPKDGLAARLDAIFDKVQHIYVRLLKGNLEFRAPAVIFALIVFVSLPFLFLSIPSELAPEEDQGALLSSLQGPKQANNDYMNTWLLEMHDKLMNRGTYPEVDRTFLLGGGRGTINTAFGGVTMVPWGERDRTTMDMKRDFQGTLNTLAGVRAVSFAPSVLPGADGLPIQFVVTSTSSYEAMAEIADEFLRRAKASGLLIYVDNDLEFDTPRLGIDIDRDKAGAYGVSMQDIGMAMALMTGGNYISRVNLGGRSYKVIQQVPDDMRRDAHSIGRFHVRTDSGELIPLSSLITETTEVQPQVLNQFNQLNSFTISGVPMPGFTAGDVLDGLKAIGSELLTKGYSIDYTGPLRQYVKEGNTLVLTFVLALIIIYLVLAAQFESLRDPLVIMVSVPLSISGALIPLVVDSHLPGGSLSMNIYSQVGLVTLIGLITKHGILMCEVAKERQIQENLSKTEAILVAASLRLRPILMTTAAMVFALIPLLMSKGAGAESRHAIAIVIVFGMSIGTLFTLFILPVIYTFLASDHRRTEEDLIREQGIEALNLEEEKARLEGAAPRPAV